MTVMNRPDSVFHPKDPISSLTHFIGFLFSIAAAPFVLAYASAYHPAVSGMISVAVFFLTMSLLYGASAGYHAFHISEKADRILRKIDHCNIFLLIAGSYTPVCMLAMSLEHGLLLLGLIWSLAIAGIIFKLCWITCPKWVSSVLYILMGWVCLIFIPEIRASIGSLGFGLLLLEGIFYTVGGVIYALKPAIFPKEKETGFGNHELFHLFVMAGSLFHFLLVLLVLIPMA